MRNRKIPAPVKEAGISITLSGQAIPSAVALQQSYRPLHLDDTKVNKQL